VNKDSKRVKNVKEIRSYEKVNNNLCSNGCGGRNVGDEQSSVG